MGFSLYWTQTEVSVEVFKRFQHVLGGFLKHAAFKRRDDGFVVFQTQNEDDMCESFITERIPYCENYSCKTNRLPYTEDVAKALVLMFEFGITNHISADDNIYLKDALKDVHTIYPLAKYTEIEAALNDD